LQYSDKSVLFSKFNQYWPAQQEPVPSFRSQSTKPLLVLNPIPVPEMFTKEAGEGVADNTAGYRRL
jgi:hypothetical protein